LPIVPEPKGPATAVFVTGGKQYRVSAGDQVLVGRLAAEVGEELTIDRVLFHADGDEIRIGTPMVDGLTITAKVLRHTRGPRLEVLRYKSKKRVRVHKGARTDFTAIQILAIGGEGEKDKPAAKGRAKKAEAEPAVAAEKESK